MLQPKEKASKKSELRVHHSIHDRVQMESTYTFDLRPRGDEQQREFKVDLYLYVPNSVGVNSSNFGSEDFFRHTTSYLRVRAPLYQHLRSISPDEFRFDSAEEYFEGHLSSLERARLSGRVIQDVKLYGNFLYTEFKKLTSSLKKSRKDSLKDELAESIFHRTELLWSYRRRYMNAIHDEKFLLDDEVIRAFTLTDEYLSYRVELLLLQLKETHPAKTQARVDKLLQKEMYYRKQNGMLVLAEETRDSVGFEAYTYRLGLLKKYLGEPLFLKLVSNKKDNLYKNYAAAVGAGLAATVAGLAEHQRVQYLTGNDSGIRLAFLIGIAVLAYIFKDRVKDLSKEYFNSRLKERLPDQSFALSHLSYGSDGATKIRELGECSEFFRFVKEVPADVAYLRSLGQVRTSDPARRENVIHIGRRFNFDLSKKHRKIFPLLKNVLRLEITPFLNKLDNPTMPIHFVDDEGGTRTVQAPKVYHLNVVKRYEVKFGTGDGNRLVDYERFRLVLDKDGILRLEKIVRQGHLSYEATGT